MKNLIVLISLTLASCAQLTPKQQDNQWKEVFKGYTACTEKEAAILRVQSLKNVFGNEVSRSYSFKCGKERYACSIHYNQVAYRWDYRCMNKVAYTR